MKIDCVRFEEQLEALLDGRLTAELAADLRRHAAECASCGSLVALFDEELESAPDLSEAILARTSGPACERAREEFCDWVDGELHGLDHELITRHAAACAECGWLASVMRATVADLPLLAELEPAQDLVAGVLARTVRAEPAVRRWPDTVADLWARLVQRPRAAFELAYLGTAVLMLVLLIPSSPLAGLPDRAFEAARVNPVRELSGPINEASHRLRAELGMTSREVFWGSIVQRSATEIDRAGERLGTFWHSVASEQVTEDATSERDANKIQGER